MTNENFNSEDVKSFSYLNSAIPQQQNTTLDNLTKWQLSTEEIIIEFENELKGLVYNPATDAFESKGKQLLNDEGIRIVISTVRSTTNRVFFLSNLKEQHAYDITLNFANDLTQVLMNNIKEFEIDVRRGFQTLIITKSSYIIFSALLRAVNGGERTFLTSTTQTLVKIDDSPQQKKSGGGGFWGLFGKGE